MIRLLVSVRNERGSDDRCVSNASVTPNSRVTHAPQRTDTDTDTDKKIRKGEFEEWYALYPKKEAREAARRAFPKARLLASFDDLMAGVRRYAAKNIERQFIKQPATWLNSGCWADEEAPKVKVNGHEVPSGIFVKHGTPEWAVWSDHVFKTTGRGPPTTDKRVDGRFVTGWYFPTPVPEKQLTAVDLIDRCIDESGAR